MSKIHVSRSIILYLALFLAGVLISPLLSSLLPNSESKVDQSALAQAGSPDAIPAGVNSPNDPNFETWVCTPNFVGEFIDRVHVHCTVSVNGISWFATPTSDAKRAARVYSTLLTAIAAGKNVRIYYDSTASGAAYGCSYSDCRPIKYIEFIK